MEVQVKHQHLRPQHPHLPLISARYLTPLYWACPQLQHPHLLLMAALVLMVQVTTLVVVMVATVAGLVLVVVGRST